MAVYLGANIAERLVIADGEDQPFDPVSLRLALVAPDGQETIYIYAVDGNISRISPGIYDVIMPATNQIGNWILDAEISFQKNGVEVTLRQQKTIPVIPIAAATL